MKEEYARAGRDMKRKVRSAFILSLTRELHKEMGQAGSDVAGGLSRLR